MATSAGRSRLFPVRSRKSYRLEMEGRTLYLLLGLMALTGIVIFYLGVVTGKALRNPNAQVPLSAQIGTPAAKTDATPAKPGSLSFNQDVKSDQNIVEGLQMEGQSTAKRTDALLKEAQKQVQLKEVPPAASTPAVAMNEAPKPAAKPSAPAAPVARAPATRAPAPPARPARSAAVAQDHSLYTVQVFSSKHQDTAQRLVERLRRKGFGAYLNRYQAPNNEVWYRVRVGKTDHAGAEALRQRLRREARLKNPQIQKL